MAEPRRRRIKWPDHPVIAYVSGVGVFILGSIGLATLFHTRVVWGLVLPMALISPEFTSGSRPLRRYLERLSAPAGHHSHDLASAWAARWRLVLVHSIGGALFLTLVYGTFQGAGLRSTLIGAAVFMIPASLCALIIDIGGAFGVPGRS